MIDEILEFLRAELRPYLTSRDRKPLRQQIREVREVWKTYRCIPYHYLKHRLYDRSARPEFLDYLPARLAQRFRRDRNPGSLIRMLDDKVQTTQRLAGIGIRCVETLFSIDVKGVVRGGDGEAIAATVAAELLRAHGGKLFVKPVDLNAGRGAFSIQANCVDADWIDSLRNMVIQPALRNHPLIESLYADALNTVRLVSLVEQGRCTLVVAMLRVGQGGAMVDNVSQGGIGVSVDLASGALARTGLFKGLHGRVACAQHPDTGVAFASISLPWWRETCAMAECAALGLQPHTMLGLDIAITADGPVFIEANGAADVFYTQEICGPLGKTPLGRSILAHWLRPRDAAPTA